MKRVLNSLLLFCMVSVPMVAEDQAADQQKKEMCSPIVRVGDYCKIPVQELIDQTYMPNTGDLQKNSRGSFSHSTGPFTILTSGVYQLTGPISATTGSTITISASDVVLDLNGFVVSNSLASTGIAINVTGSSNVDICNGTVSNSAFGVQTASSTSNHRILNCDIVSSSNTAIWARANSMLIKYCRIFSSGSIAFRFDTSTSNSNVEDCEVIGYTGTAFSITAGSKHRIIRCAAQDTDSLGTAFSISASNIEIVDCDILNGGTGISVTGSNCIIIRNNVQGVSGTGIDASTTNNYVAQNIAKGNVTNYGGSVSSTFIASQAAAEGVDNVDGDLV